MIKIALTGDSLITRGLGDDPYEGFSEIQKILLEHDVRFTNLETCIRKDEGEPSLFPGGTYVYSHPSVLDSLKKFGFNLFSIANNHCMDFGVNGLKAMLNYLQNKNIIYSGAGNNLYEAECPAFIDFKERRVALISCTSSFHDSDAAGYQGKTSCGRTGVNPLRHIQKFYLPDNLFHNLKEIAELSGVDSYHKQAIKEGYLPEKDCISIGGINFYQGNIVSHITYPREDDENRILTQVRDAKRQANAVILSIHSHQFKGGGKENTPDFIVELSKKAIDNGASIICCHGPHLLRNIEKYKNGIILYGLGDFILHNETVLSQPYEFHLKYNSSEVETGLAFDLRSKNGSRGLVADEKAYQSIIESIVLDDDGAVISNKSYPVELGFGRKRSESGWPVLSNS